MFKLQCKETENIHLVIEYGRGTWRVWRKKNTSTVSVRNPEGKRPLIGPKMRGISSLDEKNVTF
jgi:hypothetical protein